MSFNFKCKGENLMRGKLVISKRALVIALAAVLLISGAVWGFAQGASPDYVYACVKEDRIRLVLNQGDCKAQETSFRIPTGSITDAMQSAIDDEATERQAADGALQAGIDAEETARAAADTMHANEIAALERWVASLSVYHPKQVFVTSVEYPWTGDLDVADAACQERAESGGLPGIYKAWLSTEAASPSTRFTHAMAPYTLVDGTQIAADWADLTDGGLDTPINLTESGSGRSIIGVWTMTTVSGEFSGGCGLNDTGKIVGANNHNNGGWTQYSCYGSGWSLPIYCFQQ
jgi:hypothetical protein